MNSSDIAPEIAWGVDAAMEKAEARTRRERIATAIFAGMWASPMPPDRRGARTAVWAADKLIEALDSTDDGAR